VLNALKIVLSFLSAFLLKHSYAKAIVYKNELFDGK
tara:strand:- start:6934 stop:7041 length:108 start_codon:yes stop_codon:yes gene_type:complete